MGTEPATPPDEKPSAGTSNGSAGPELWRFFGAGMQLCFTVLLFVALGWYLDGKFGWSPWGIVGLGMLGVAAGMYHFIKDVSR